MVNYIVDDPDAVLGRLKQEGVKIDAKRMNESYGPVVVEWPEMALRLVISISALADSARSVVQCIRPHGFTKS
jgi:hypothetical protein